MKAVVNASPLIFLAKLDRLDLLPSPCASTPRVLEEVRAGAPAGHPEAVSVEAVLVSGDLQPIEPKAIDLPVTAGLHAGERSVLALAVERGIGEVIVDDRLAIRAAKVAGLAPVSTAFLLLRARRAHALDARAYEDLLARLIEHGYFLSASIYQRLVDAGRKT